MRPIEVAPIASRLVSAVLARRLNLWANLNDDQAGFRPGRCTADQNLVLHILSEITAYPQRLLYVAFLDFPNAFSTVNHEKLFELLLKKGIPYKTFRFLQILYASARTTIKWNQSISESFSR